MDMYKLQSRQVLALDRDEAWNFFSQPANLKIITPPWLAMTVRSDVPEKMYPGLIVIYTITPFPGVNMRWVTEITHVEEKVSFVDEQRFGPYQFWHHLHSFSPLDDGILMEDIVHFALPLGPLGRIVGDIDVAKRVKSIFDFRSSVLIDRYEGSKPAETKLRRV